MPKTYHTIIIGAGIAGASVAYALKARGHRVLVLDKHGIASGGSGAAGAFVSPKIGKASALHSLTNEAYEVARDFYSTHTPKHFHQSSVIRIPKDEADAAKFPIYEAYNQNAYEKYSPNKLQALGVDTAFESFCFPDAGMCDAGEICALLLEGIDVVIHEVTALEKIDDLWAIEDYRAENIVLCTGYESDIVEQSYMGIQGVWGTRGDFASGLGLAVSMHQSMSVGANIDGIIRLGATHERGVKTPIDCDDTKSIDLKNMASALVDTSDFKLIKSFCGMRAGSKDYAPLVGKVIDVKQMLESNPRITKGGTPALQYIDNLYVLNGLGGRGFVFAPLLCEMLVEHILEGKEIDKRVNPDRLFYKWCRKL